MGIVSARPLVKDATVAQSFIARSSNGLQIRKGNLNRHKDGRNEFFQGSRDKNFRGGKVKNSHFFSAPVSFLQVCWYEFSILISIFYGLIQR